MLMVGKSQGIQGITRKSLFSAWGEVRKELRRALVRDVVDWLDYDIDPSVWVNRLLRQIANGTYEPSPPHRYTLAKSKGFSRRITFPQIPDLVLYRACVDYLYGRLRRNEHAHVYFERNELSKARQRAIEEATPPDPNTDPFEQAVDEMVLDYASGSTRRYRAWLKYDQYRKYLIFEQIYPYIVTTDITNFFDSVLYTHVAESLHAVPAPSRLVGLLFVLLERLSFRGGIREAPRVGLPVDEFDCSRKLAHMVLFPHDDIMVHQVGEEAYIRWMDDQNLGVGSRADALRALAALGDSLTRLHLTPNAGKTRILTISEAKEHFHLEANKLLDEAEEMPRQTVAQRRALARKCREVWRTAKPNEMEGHWDKVLKRLYRHVGLSRSRFLRRRARLDVLRHPSLTGRIVNYVRTSGTASEYLDFIESLWWDAEQVYPDVNLVLVESLLRVEPGTPEEQVRIRRLGSALLKGEVSFIGAKRCAAAAPLIILRFGDRRSLPLLRRIVEHEWDRWPSPLVRSAAAVYATFGRPEYQTVKRAAAKIWRNPLTEIVRMVDRISQYDRVHISYKSRFSLRPDSVMGTPYVDMRSVVAGRLLALNRTASVQNWLKERRKTWEAKGISEFDQAMISRLLP